MSDASTDVDRLTGPDERRFPLWTIPLSLTIACALAIALTWPTGTISEEALELGLADDFYTATIDEVTGQACSFDETQLCVLVGFGLDDGPDAGTIDRKEYLVGPGLPEFALGATVILGYIPDGPPEVRYQFVDYDRSAVLWIVAGLFAAAVIGLGRLRGLAALGGLVASVGIIIFYIVPAITEGADPVLTAMIGAVAVGLVALYLAHGINDLTHVATIGTVGALAITTVLSAATVSAARLSGFVGEDSFTIALAGVGDIQGLVLAGIVLGSLGALDDVTVTQASTVWELRRAAPHLGRQELYRSGLRVGRDHIASTVNTLLLAYAGASMPLLLRLAVSGQSFGALVNSESIATEVIRTLVGSIGLVLAVPITTWLSAALARVEGRVARAG